MAYPPAPWKLSGIALLTLHLVDRQRARQFVPAAIELVPLLPGKTLAVVYVAAYGSGSTLEYHELIVAVLARSGRRFGFWIAGIYVDNSDSVAGGGAIWGLPKQLAEFRWQTGKASQVEVRQGNQQLCTLRCHRFRSLWRQPLLLPVLSQREHELLWFSGTLSARVGVASGQLTVAGDSVWAPLELGGSVTAFQLSSLRLVARPPRVIGDVAPVPEQPHVF